MIATVAAEFREFEPKLGRSHGPEVFDEEIAEYNLLGFRENFDGLVASLNLPLLLRLFHLGNKSEIESFAERKYSALPFSKACWRMTRLRILVRGR